MRIMSDRVFSYFSGTTPSFNNSVKQLFGELQEIPLFLKNSFTAFHIDSNVYSNLLVVISIKNSSLKNSGNVGFSIISLNLLNDFANLS